MTPEEEYVRMMEAVNSPASGLLGGNVNVPAFPSLTPEQKAMASVRPRAQGIVGAIGGLLGGLGRAVGPGLQQASRAIYGDDEMTRLRRQNAFQAMTLNPNQALITANAAQIQKLQEQELLKEQGRAAANVLTAGVEGVDPMRQQISAMVSQGLITPNQGLALLSKNPTNIDQILSMSPEALKKLQDIGYFASMPGQQWEQAQYQTYVNRQQELRANAIGSRNLINDISNVALLLSRIPETGPQEQTKQDFRAFFRKFQMPVDEEALSNAQSLQAAVTRLVAQELRKNKGPQTDFDAIFLATTLPGLGTSEQANADILQYMMAQNELITSLSDIANVTGNFDVVSGAVNMADDLASKAPTFILGENASPVYFTEFKDAYKKENPNGSAAEMLNDWILLADRSRSVYSEFISNMGLNQEATRQLNLNDPFGILK